MSKCEWVEEEGREGARNPMGKNKMKKFFLSAQAYVYIKKSKLKIWY